MIQTPGIKTHWSIHYFIQGLHADLKGHVILGQPQTLAETEHLAKLKEAVSTNTPNLVQQKLEAQLQSVTENLETLATTQQTIVVFTLSALAQPWPTFWQCKQTLAWPDLGQDIWAHYNQWPRLVEM
jgi:hypothetical protein